MQNFVFSEAIERALRSDGDFQVTVVEKSQDVAGKCSLLAANALLMEVTGKTPWKLEECLEIRKQVKKNDPDCKIVLFVDENTDVKIAEDIKQAKRDGLIDLFIFGSTSVSYLVALMDTL